MVYLASPWLWVPVLVIALGTVIAVPRWQARKRKQEASAIVTGFGFTPHRTRKPFSRTERKPIPLLRHPGRKFENVFADGEDRLLFDYRYSFGIPLHAGIYYWQTVAAFRVRMNPFPNFQLHPATRIDRLIRRFARRTVEIQGQENFTKRYWLRGSDSVALGALFTPDRIARLFALDPDGRWSVEKGGNWLVVYSKGMVFAPNSLSGSLAHAEALAKILSFK